MKQVTLLLTLFIWTNVTIGQSVILGTGTGISVFSPIDRHRDYSVYEIIYLQSQINMAGPVNAIDIQRLDGSNTDSIENVRVYMKHTSATTLSGSNYDTTGYSLVFTGSFPNDAGAGWRGVQLDSSFAYNNSQNLQVMFVKDYQPAIANTPVAPRWLYTSTTGGTRARRYYGYVPITTSTALGTTTYNSNVRLTFNTVSVVEISGGSTPSVYPNPSRGKFNIVCPPEIKVAKMIIMNLAGQIVFRKSFSADELLETPVFSPGIYFLRITEEGQREIYTAKLLVE